MNVLVVVGLIFVAFYGVEARSIQPELPQVLVETIEQTLACTLELGPKARNLPKAEDFQQLPEDNEALNQLWGCIWIKKGIVNHNGDVDSANLENYLSNLLALFAPEQASLASDIVETCKNKQADNYGQKVVKVNNCITDRLQKIIQD